jgi:5-methylcytosine-specific restriction protein A
MQRTFLLTWNPNNWPWNSLDDDLRELRFGRVFQSGWSCGNRRDLPQGSRVFLMKLGKLPDSSKGLIASGIAVTRPFEYQHWDEGRENDVALYVDVEFDNLELQPIVPLPALRALSPSFKWTPQRSGIEIPLQLATALEEKWATVPAPILPLPEQLPSGERFSEGVARTIRVNAFERSKVARDACVKHYGPSCLACGMDFERIYGPPGRGFIHVHHVVPLSEVGEGYEVDPISDLRPLCPNCHAVAHMKDPPYTVEELEKIIRAQRSAV